MAAMRSLRGGDYVIDGPREVAPRVDLVRELAAAGGRQSIHLDAAALRGQRRPAGDPATILEAVESGVERPLIHRQHVARHLLNPFRNRPAVQRCWSEALEDEPGR